MPPAGRRVAARRRAYHVTAAACACWLAAWLVVVIGSRARAPLWAAAAVLACAGLPAAAAEARARSAQFRGRAPSGRVAHYALAAAALAAVSAAVSVNAIMTSPLAAAAKASAVITADVRVAGEPHPVRVSGPKPRQRVVVVDASTILVRIHHQAWRCATPVRLLLSPDDGGRLRMGDTVRVVARAGASRVGDRSAAYLRVLDPPLTVAQAPWWARAADSWRSGLRAAATSPNRDASGLLPALAIGDTSLAPRSLTDDMQASGLSHLSAVSGANVSIVLAAVVLLALLCRVRGRWLAIVCLVALLWFVLVARASPSVVRAAVMGGIGVLPVLAGWQRKPGGVDALLALSLAASVLIVVDPWLAVSWGFALSCAATAGLVVGASMLMRRLDAMRARRSPGSHWDTGGMTTPARLPSEVAAGSGIRRGSRFAGRVRGHSRALLSRGRRRLATWFLSAAIVTVSAQVAVTPLLLAMGASVSWVALPANVLAEPAVAPATISGLLASAASQVSPEAAAVIAKPGLAATAWIAAVAHRSARAARSAQVPFPWHRDGFPDDAVAVLCDVGQGTAFALPLGQGRAIVVDVGPEPGPIDTCLRRLGVRDVPLLVLSHFHADHVGGLAGLLRGRSVGAVAVSPLAEPSAGARAVDTLLHEHGVTPVVVADGAHIDVGTAAVDVLSPTSLLLGVDSPPNDDCVSVVMTVPLPERAAPLRVLAPCDLEFAGQYRLLAAHQALKGRFDIALVPHHGSRRQLPSFAAWASPSVALIPVGRANDYGHPAASTVSMWSRVSGAVARTDLRADLVVTACGQRMCLRAATNPESRG